MGTRHLITVVVDGNTKIAQYGQWDGYPTGQGDGIVKFILSGKLPELKANLSKVRFFEPEDRDKDFLAAYDAATPEWSNEPDNRTNEQKRWFQTYITRDLGADILMNVALSTDEEILLRDESEFAKDALFCEWAYVLDLDKEVLDVFEDGGTLRKSFAFSELTTGSMRELEESLNADD